MEGGKRPARVTELTAIAVATGTNPVALYRATLLQKNPKEQQDVPPRLGFSRLGRSAAEKDTMLIAQCPLCYECYGNNPLLLITAAVLAVSILAKFGARWAATRRCVRTGVLGCCGSRAMTSLHPESDFPIACGLVPSDMDSATMPRACDHSVRKQLDVPLPHRGGVLVLCAERKPLHDVLTAIRPPGRTSRRGARPADARTH